MVSIISQTAAFSRKACLIAVCFFLGSCQSYLFDQKCPSDITEVQEKLSFEIEPVDILFVIDNSGSMSDEQQNLASNFNRFIEVLADQVDLDYRIAAVTTDQAPNSNIERTGSRTVFSPVPANTTFEPRYLSSDVNESNCLDSSGAEQKIKVVHL